MGNDWQHTGESTPSVRSFRVSHDGRLIKMLRAGHKGAKLPDADLRRLAAWIDCNAVFHGSYEAGESGGSLVNQPLPMPAIQ